MVWNRRSPPGTAGVARWAAAAALAALLAAPLPAWADNTTLADPGGVFELEAPGRWHMERSDHALKATGFLSVFRAELFGDVYDNVDAEGAARKWKEWRLGKQPEVTFVHPDGDSTRWIVRNIKRKVTDYVRAIAAGDKAAVLWLRVSRPPGELDADAFAILAAAKMSEREIVERATKKDDAAGEPVVVKVGGFRIEVTLPAGMVARDDVKPDDRRLLSFKGPVGDDAEAYVDIYGFPGFDRIEAVGAWWVEAERRGWEPPVKIDGAPPAFRVLVQGKTWNRHVRLLETDAGIFGIKVDVEAYSDREAHDLVTSFHPDDRVKVLKRFQKVPTPPQGFQRLEDIEDETHFVFYEGDLGEAEPVAARAKVIDGWVGEALDMEAWNGRKGILRIYRDRTAYETAVKPLGGAEGSAIHWDLANRTLLTHPDALSDPAQSAAFALDAARESIQRRFGFRPPFWVEYGLGLYVEASGHNRGRVGQPHPFLIEGARNAAGGTMEFEAVRWWITHDSVGNNERRAVAWSLFHMFLVPSPLAKKWEPPFRAFLAKLRDVADPGLANKQFDFSRDTELVEDWGKQARRL